ncbi:MAG: CPBP family intramembrane metalloprotease [Chloroflexi bacterium]|nr:CPBP family intramembrane metalloprotease [Chloroflexota bacterium]
MSGNGPGGWRNLVFKAGRVRPTLRALVFLPALGGAGLGIGLLVLMALGVLGTQPLAASAFPSERVIEAGGPPTLILPVAALLFYLVLVLLGTLAFRRLLDGRSFTSLGFHRARGWLADTLFGLVLGLALMSLITAAEWGMGWLQIRGFVWETRPAAVVWLSLGYSLWQFVVVAINEETMSRGYILQNLEEDWGVKVAVVSSSVVFGLLHSANPNVSALALFNLFVAGLLFAYGYTATRQLWLPIALHFSWNFFQGPVFGFPVSGGAGQGLLVTSVNGPDLITGGAFGPEGGLIGLGAMVVGIGAIWGWGMRGHRGLEGSTT